MCTLLSYTLTHTYTHKHTDTHTAQCRIEGSVMDSPEHVCVVANALRQGTWVTTAPRGSSASADDRSQHRLSFRRGNGTRRMVILPLSASITVTSLNHRLCFNPSCRTGGELSSSVMLSGVTWYRVSLMAVCRSRNVELLCVYINNWYRIASVPLWPNVRWNN